MEETVTVKNRKVVRNVNYDAIIQRAREIATQRMKSGEPVGPDDTVCVLSSASGRLFTGLNHFEMQNGAVHNVHAEIEAIRNMQVMGESVIETLLPTIRFRQQAQIQMGEVIVGRPGALRANDGRGSAANDDALRANDDALRANDDSGCTGNDGRAPRE